MHPFEILKAKNPDGLDQLVTDIKQRIVEVDAFITKYAEDAGQPELANKDFLYELFKRDIQENLSYGLREVFAHYYCILKKQILNEMIGVHQFDERDIEILKYFHDDFVLPKNCSNHIHIDCPSMFVLETNFSLIVGAKVCRYVHIFYKTIAYAYDALIRAYGGTTPYWNPSISIDSLLDFDMDDFIVRSIKLSNTKSFSDSQWVRRCSERINAQIREIRKTNGNNYSLNQKERKGREYMQKKHNGLVRIKINGKNHWVNKSDTIFAIVKGPNPFKYVLRSRASKEQIDFYENHREDIENKFNNRYKNTGMKKKEATNEA